VNYKNKPDVVHLHSSKAGVLGESLAVFKPKPMSFIRHGYAFLRTDISPMSKDIGYRRFFQKFFGITIACGDSSLKWQNISENRND
jgi:hypothetical protein